MVLPNSTIYEIDWIFINLRNLPVEGEVCMFVKNKPKAKRKIFKAVHETASDFHRLGFIGARKMRKYDAKCIAPSMLVKR